jgi:metal-responsive CopG/Arc/MetJ family transcriptional regulator
MTDNTQANDIDAISIDLPQDLIDGLVDESVASGQSVNDVIRQAIEHYLIFVSDAEKEIGPELAYDDEDD